MSYCRWSSDDWWSDIYAFESAQGFEIHVAGNRLVPAEPFPPAVSYEADPDAFIKRMVEVSRIAGMSEHMPIGLPFDGETYIYGEPREAADKLEELRAAGYHVPQYAIDGLRAETAAATPADDETMDRSGLAR